MGPQTEGVHAGQWPNPPRATGLIALHRDCLTKGTVSLQIFSNHLEIYEPVYIQYHFGQW
jgi:hypothetical protein